MTTLRSRNTIVGKAAVFAALATVTSLGLRAQSTAEQPAATDDKDVVKMEKFIATGSYIPFSAEATANPVTVVNAVDIANSSASGDLLEVIRKTVPQFVGSGNLGSSNSNIGGGSTNGGRQALLRNTTTLVLINGRRAAFAPVAATGGYNFVDINSIPVNAVERIEILTDGASATYGSDAVAGVVNVILKKDYQGFEVSGGYAFARGADSTSWSQRSANFVTGAVSNGGKTSVTVSGEWVKSEPLFQSERSYTQDQTGKTPNFPGVVGDDTAEGYIYLLNPSLKAPPAHTGKSMAQLVAEGIYGPADYDWVDTMSKFNLSPYVTLLMGNERMAATMNVEHKVSENMTVFAEALLANTKSFYQLAAQPVGIYSVLSWPEDPEDPTAPYDPNNPTNELLYPANRFVTHPRQFSFDTNSIRVLAGVRGKLSDTLSYEAGANYNRVTQDSRTKGVLDRFALATAVNSGTLNLYAREQDAVAEKAGIFGMSYTRNVSSLSTFDARISGDIPGFKMPAGPIKFATGIEYRRETLSADPDAGSQLVTDRAAKDPLTGRSLFGQPRVWVGATSETTFNASRSAASTFAEVRIPLTDKSQGIKGLYTTELGIAGRFEDYSHTSSDPVVPKVTLRYLPFNDEFALRASYGKSFTVPDLFSLYGPTGVGFTPQLSGFYTYNAANPSSPIKKNLSQANSSTPSNPLLKPRHGEMYNFGSVYSPRYLKGLTVEVGYFHSEERDFISSIGSRNILQDVELFGAQSEYVSRVHIGSFTGPNPTAPGQVSGSGIAKIYVENGLINAGMAVQDGVDFKATYSKEIAGFGTIDASFAGFWYNSYRVDGFETTGRTTESNGTIPKYQTYTSVRFKRGGLHTGIGMSFVPGVDEYASGEVQSEVPSFMSFDFYVGYEFDDRHGKILDGASIQFGIDNVFDRNPPMSQTVNSDAGYDVGAYGDAGTLGRVFKITISKKF